MIKLESYSIPTILSMLDLTVHLTDVATCFTPAGDFLVGGREIHDSGTIF